MTKSLRRIGLTVAAVAALFAFESILVNRSGSHKAPQTQVKSAALLPEYHDAALLDRAWALPVAAAYGRDSYEFQANQSFCGPTSAANLLRSTGIAATQRSVLQGTGIRTFLGYLPTGLTLDQEAQVLRSHHAIAVTVLRDLSLSEFRAQMLRTNDRSLRYIANFHRGPLFGQGHGHFSPLLGYLANEDLVFVGDVNHDFQPFLVSSARLYAAVNTVDSDTGKKRGLIRVEAPGAVGIP